MSPNATVSVKCKCGDRESAHTRGNNGRCTKRKPVKWVGTGRNRQPVIGYCPCVRYEPEGE